MAGGDYPVSLMRKAVSQAARSRTRVQSLPAPVLGWVSAQNLSTAKKGTALQLDGWFPTQTGIRLLGGSQLFATVSETGERCTSLMSYVGAVRELFGASDGSIFNITAPADPEAEETADVTGQTSDYYSYVNYATAGDFYMYAVNGTDKPLLYDGSTWLPIDAVSTPAIVGVTSTLLSHVNPYRNRLYFVEGGSLNVWATDPDSLGGTMVQISLAGVIRKGGSVLFTGTWSLDAGDGLDDKLVIVTTEGEVAVYQGSDPADATDWSLVGLYECPKPLGKNASMRAGGDLVILTEQGAVPVSQIIVKDPAALALAAISRAIQPDWVAEGAVRQTYPWEVVKWPSRSMGIVSTPSAGPTQMDQVFIVNLETGAWCKRTGWGATCLALHDDDVYFGTADGRVMKADAGGYDGEDNYECSVVMAWDHAGSPGHTKTVTSARAQFVASTPFNPQLSASANYTIELPAPPNVLLDTGGADAWDSALWDDGVWDAAGANLPINTRWVSIGQTGYVIAAQIQVTVGSSTRPDVEFVTIDQLIETGEVMV